MFIVTSTWKSSFLGAHAGVLVIRNVSNPAHDAELEKQIQVTVTSKVAVT